MSISSRFINHVALAAAAFVATCAIALASPAALAEQRGPPAERSRAYDGGYFVAGEAGGGPGKYEGLLIKADSRGNVEWRRPCGEARDVFVRTGIRTGDGGFALAGSIGDREDVETWDVYLLKLGPVRPS